MICNLPGLDEETSEKASRFVKERVGLKNILSTDSNFITFLVRKDEVTELEFYFTRVLRTPENFRLTVAEFTS